MLPNKGRQNFHSTEDGFPTVKSLFIVLFSPNHSLTHYDRFIIILLLKSAKYMFDIFIILILYGEDNEYQL